MSAQTLTLIFPMAGEGARFGYRFKPVPGGARDAIHRSRLRTLLLSLACTHRHIRFVFTRAQEKIHGASARLDAISSPGLPVRCCLLEAPTPGPAETLRQAAAKLRGISGPPSSAIAITRWTSLA